ncbi:MAG: hypothetical protein ACFFG0_07145 [Candidatus Thorarchaeota archaeon]
MDDDLTERKYRAGQEVMNDFFASLGLDKLSKDMARKLIYLDHSVATRASLIIALRKGISGAELGREIKRGKTATNNILQELITEGIVEFNPERKNKAYSIKGDKQRMGLIRYAEFLGLTDL